jgi:hypothetical protein
MHDAFCPFTTYLYTTRSLSFIDAFTRNLHTIHSHVSGLNWLNVWLKLCTPWPPSMPLRTATPTHAWRFLSIHDAFLHYSFSLVHWRFYSKLARNSCPCIELELTKRVTETVHALTSYNTTVRTKQHQQHKQVQQQQVQQQHVQRRQQQKTNKQPTNKRTTCTFEHRFTIKSYNLSIDPFVSLLDWRYLIQRTHTKQTNESVPTWMKRVNWITQFTSESRTHTKQTNESVPTWMKRVNWITQFTSESRTHTKQTKDCVPTWLTIRPFKNTRINRLTGLKTFDKNDYKHRPTEHLWTKNNCTNTKEDVHHDE